MPIGGFLPLSGNNLAKTGRNMQAGGFNPLSILSGPIAGGLPSASSSASSSAYQEIYFDSPFNVGSGSATSAANQPGNQVASIANSLIPFAVIMGGVWLARQIL
jgi:hypothetical protein